MQITVAGQNRSDELGPILEQNVSGRSAIADIQARIDEQADVLALKEFRTSTAFLDAFTQLVSRKGYVQPDTFPLPCAQGPASRVFGSLRRVLWKLTRWQSDAMAFQQNAANQQLAGLLAFEKAERERQVQALQERLDALESGGPSA